MKIISKYVFNLFKIQSQLVFYLFHIFHIFRLFILLYNIINTKPAIMSLNAIYYYDYLFEFYTNDITDLDKFNTIYNQCTLEDPSGNRKVLIYNKYLEILQILSKTPGIRTCSSFVNYNNKRYKVTVHNMSWSGNTT